MGYRERLAQELQKRQGSIPDAGNDNQALESEVEAVPTSKFFFIENVRNYPTCLDLRLSDGKAKAVPYSYIIEMNFDASEGIELITASKNFLITGRNLQLLYNYLVKFRVSYIQANVGNDLTDEKSLFVKDIKIQDA